VDMPARIPLRSAWSAPFHNGGRQSILDTNAKDDGLPSTPPRVQQGHENIEQTNQTLFRVNPT
jgi:hypothetical protein